MYRRRLNEHQNTTTKHISRANSKLAVGGKMKRGGLYKKGRYDGVHQVRRINADLKYSCKRPLVCLFVSSISGRSLPLLRVGGVFPMEELRLLNSWSILRQFGCWNAKKKTGGRHTPLRKAICLRSKSTANA